MDSIQTGIYCWAKPWFTCWLSTGISAGHGGRCRNRELKTLCAQCFVYNHISSYAQAMFTSSRTEVQDFMTVRLWASFSVLPVRLSVHLY